jgi:hypothetical protein
MFLEHCMTIEIIDVLHNSVEILAGIYYGRHVFDPLLSAAIRARGEARGSYECRVTTTEQQLHVVHSYIKNCNIGDTPSIDYFRAVLDRSPEIIYALWKHDGLSSEKIVGFYCIMPLTKKAAQQLRSGTRLVGGPRPEDIVKSWDGASGIYIAGIAADKGNARGHLEAALNVHIFTIICHKLRKTKGTPLFTRPLTDDGIRTAEKYGFKRVGEGSAIFVLELSPNTSLHH